MEYAAKALEIAGGVLIAILIVSLFTYMFNSLSSYQAMTSTNDEMEKLEAFNKKYTAYQKSILYGADVISVMNMALSYNAGVYEEGGSGSYSDDLTAQKKYGYFDANNTLKINVTFILHETLYADMYGINSGVSTVDANAETADIDGFGTYNEDDFDLTGTFAGESYSLADFNMMNAWNSAEIAHVKNNPILMIIPADDTEIGSDGTMTYYLKNQSERFINKIFTCTEITYYANTGRVRTLTFEELNTSSSSP